MVTNPRSGFLTIDSRFSAVSVLMRSAIFWARAVSATGPPHIVGTGAPSTLVTGGGVDGSGRHTARGVPPAPRTSSASGARLLAHLVGGDEVLELEVVERAQVDAALEALADLGDVV